ncbi:MAG: dicarboxylate/amino acid:cation symporter [bacterium]
MARHYQLLIGLISGIVLGIILHPFSDVPWLVSLNQNFLFPIGQIFLRLIFMTVVPLVFSALVMGIYELGKSHGLGKVARNTIFYTVLASSISVLVGITIVNVLEPGKSFSVDPERMQTSSIVSLQENASRAKGVSQSIVDLIPQNPVDTAARALGGEMLPFMVFSLIFGLALSRIKLAGVENSTVVAFFEQLFAVSMKMVDFALLIAPIGVFAIIFNTVFNFGFEALQSLIYFVLIVVFGLSFQQFAVYPILLWTVARRSPLKFFYECRDVFLYAFSTASSNATLPLALDTAENRLKLPPRISRFVLTVGATANQNGTALFEGVTVLFLAQAFGVELTLMEQLQVVLMSILAGIGTAGVPGGSLPMIMILLQSVRVPVESIGLILGADRFLDMCRTVLNVSGDLVVTTLVSTNVDDIPGEEPEPVEPLREI